MSSKQFDFIRSELSLELLTKITANPPSDRMMDTALINLIKTRLTNIPITFREVFVWNLYKEILNPSMNLQIVLMHLVLNQET